MKCYIIFVLTLLASFGVSAKEIPCEPNSDCSDPCIYFPDNIVFLPSKDPAFLKYKGKVFELKVGKTKVIKSLDVVAKPEGHVEETSYEGGGIKVVFTSEVTSQSCYYQDKKKRWQPVESCCGGFSNVTLMVLESGKTKTYKAVWEWGC